MEPGEEQKVCELVRDVFNEFVAPFYAKEGLDEFLRYADPILLSKRSKSNHFTLLAEEAGNLVGVIELRDFNHISLLFVASNAQHQGIAKQLLHEALEIARTNKPNLSEVSVHSSPNAVDAYERLGFRVEAGEKLEHGIRYIPMRMQLLKPDDG
jgi:predicted GNAT family N-acyltransferase